MKKALIDKLNKKAAVIGVVGLGYVGLPLALSYSEAGYCVIGLDTDAQKKTLIEKGKTYIKHINGERISAATSNGFSVSTNFDDAQQCDALIICVPTPLNKHREPDLSFVTSTMTNLRPFFRAGQIVSLESTTYPGTTEEVLRPYLESDDLVVGENIFLIYSPEREDPGNEQFQAENIPKICGGTTSNCLEVGQALYGQVINVVVPVSDTRTAEMAKLLENIHRAVNIGLVNEMKILTDRMGIDIYEVIDAAATKPFGFVPYFPGPGIGGHCIPLDPFYLTWKAREYGINTRFIELAGEVNSYMPEWVVDKISAGLNTRKRSVNGSKILILGIAYKKNVDDKRESPALEIMSQLQDKGAIIEYSDPFIPNLSKTRHHNFELSSIPLSAEMMGEYDCVVIATAHDGVDYSWVLEFAKLIVDTRGVYRTPSSKVIPA